MKVVMRQNQNALSDTDKINFGWAVKKLKASGAYDESYVKAHRDTQHADGSNDAHGGPAFFAWHREFLRRFEADLQWAAGQLGYPYSDLWGLPYWDWSVDNSKNDPIWTAGFMGPNGQSGDNQVLQGPFAFKNGWTLKYIIPGEEQGYYLKRQFGSMVPSLPTPDDVQAALRATPYDVYPWNEHSQSGFRNIAEGWIGGPQPQQPQMHNRVHVWVRGSMLPMTSPNDPVFFLHHCFIDKLWADWQRLHKNEAWYLPNGGAAPGHNLHDLMRPWNKPDDIVTPSDVLSHRALGYRYDTEDYLLPGEELYNGQWIWSADKKYYVWYGDQGVLWLVISDQDQTLWQSATTTQPPGRCIMRDDGNLVIYHIDAQGRGDPYERNPIWQSGTAGHPGGFLKVVSSPQPNERGYLVLYERGGDKYYWYQPS